MNRDGTTTSQVFEVQAADVRCINCGGSLLGLRSDASCPGCGRAVATSIAMHGADKKRAAGGEAAKALKPLIGLALILVAVAGVAVLVFVGRRVKTDYNKVNAVMQAEIQKEAKRLQTNAYVMPTPVE